MQKVDGATVKALELKAPGACRADRELLRGQLCTGKIFGAFAEQERQAVWGRVLSASTDRLIPSLSSFFADVNYLQGPADCVKLLIELNPGETVSAGLDRAFSDVNQRPNECIIQHSESTFVPIPGTISDRRKLGRRHVWISAMRDYREMPPRKETDNLLAKPRSKSSEPILCEFATLAYRVGFESEQIISLIHRSADEAIARNALLEARRPDRYRYVDLARCVEQIVSLFSTAERVAEQDVMEAACHLRGPKRSGIPETAFYEADKSSLFLGRLHSTNEEQYDEITSLFVRRSIYFAFFGKLDGELWQRRQSEREMQGEEWQDREQEQERLAREMRDRERREQEVRERDRREQDRLRYEWEEGERRMLETLRYEMEDQQKREQDRLEYDRQEQERREQERLKYEKEDQQKREQDRLEYERQQRERHEQERLKYEREDQQKREQDRLEYERQERERREQERLEYEREHQQKREQDRLEYERQERERREQERLKYEREDQQRREQDRLEYERQERERREQERLEYEREHQQRRQQEKQGRETLGKQSTETLRDKRPRPEKRRQKSRKITQDNLGNSIESEHENQDSTATPEVERQTPEVVRDNDEQTYAGDLPVMNTAASASASESTVQQKVQIHFKIKEHNEWKLVHSLLVDPSDTRNLKRLVVKYMRKKEPIYTYTKDMRLVDVETCFKNAIADGENTLYLVPRWESGNAGSDPAAQDVESQERKKRTDRKSPSSILLEEISKE